MEVAASIRSSFKRAGRSIPEKSIDSLSLREVFRALIPVAENHKSKIAFLIRYGKRNDDAGLFGFIPPPSFSAKSLPISES